MRKTIIATAIVAALVLALALSGCGPQSKADQAIARYEKLVADIDAAVAAGDQAKAANLALEVPGTMEKEFPGMKPEDFNKDQMERLTKARTKLMSAASLPTETLGPEPAPGSMLPSADAPTAPAAPGTTTAP